jgi:beta-mannanase
MFSSVLYQVLYDNSIPIADAGILGTGLRLSRASIDFWSIATNSEIKNYLLAVLGFQRF